MLQDGKENESLRLRIDVVPTCSNLIWEYLEKNYGVITTVIWRRNVATTVYFFIEEPNEECDNWMAMYTNGALHLDIYPERINIDKLKTGGTDNADA